MSPGRRPSGRLVRPNNIKIRPPATRINPAKSRSLPNTFIVNQLPAPPATKPQSLTCTKEEVRISFLPLNLRLQHPTLPVSTALQDARISLHDSRRLPGSSAYRFHSVWPICF